MNNIPHIVDSGASVMVDDTKIEFGLKIIKENPDGSADAVVKFNKPAMECIMQWGIIKMIEEGIKTYAPVSTPRRKQRTDEDRKSTRRSTAVAKGKARVASKVRKAKKA